MRRRTVLNRLKALMPWWSKVLAKIVLARLPLPYRVWKRLGVFEHGHMEDPAYALRIVRDQVRAAYGSDSFRYVLDGSPDSAAHLATLLELGPGDGIFGGIAARALGGERVILVDAGAHAPIDVASCRTMAAHLASQRLPAPEIPASANVVDVHGACGIE
jgi:hypothetical protein